MATPGTTASIQARMKSASVSSHLLLRAVAPAHRGFPSTQHLPPRTFCVQPRGVGLSDALLVVRRAIAQAAAAAPAGSRMAAAETPAPQLGNLSKLAEIQMRTQKLKMGAAARAATPPRLERPASQTALPPPAAAASVQPLQLAAPALPMAPAPAPAPATMPAVAPLSRVRPTGSSARESAVTLVAAARSSSAQAQEVRASPTRPGPRPLHMMLCKANCARFVWAANPWHVTSHARGSKCCTCAVRRHAADSRLDAGGRRWAAGARTSPSFRRN